MNIDKFIKEMSEGASLLDGGIAQAVKDENMQGIIILTISNIVTTHFEDFAQAIKSENTMLLRAMPCSCADLLDQPHSKYIKPKCERCKQLEARDE